jgi:hypothetical protein
VQVCNVSICPDTGAAGHRWLFLDFGYSGTSTVTGDAYGIHQYLFIGNSDDSLCAWYRAPAGEASWDYPEWSNRGKFAVACARNDGNASHAIYLVDLLNSFHYKIVEGEELANPALWISPQKAPADSTFDSLALDSLGQYNEPLMDENQQYFANRMLPFWSRRNDMTVVFTGTSHGEYGIDPKYFVKNKVFNLAVGSGDYAEAKTIILDYILNLCPSVRLIGCDLIVGYLGIRDMDRTWSNGVARSKGYNFDKNHGFWGAGPPARFTDLVSSLPLPKLFFTLDTLGVYQTPCGGWGAENPNVTVAPFTTDDAVFLNNFNSMKSLVKTVVDRRIHFLFMITPESPHFATTNYFSTYGPTRATAGEITAKFEALRDTFPGFFHFYDANRGGAHDYADSEAYNEDHLCAAGARKLSSRLDDLIDSIFSPTDGGK